MLGEKEDTIQILQEQLGHKLDVDSKEELYKEELDKEEQAGLKEELDALAREEAIRAELDAELFLYWWRPPLFLFGAVLLTPEPSSLLLFALKSALLYTCN